MLRSEHFCTLTGELLEPWQLGTGPLGNRIVFNVTGGSVTGPEVNGRILASGADWLLMGPDGCARLDVRIVVELDDGSMAYVTYNGRLLVPPELMAPVFDRERCEGVDPAGYYFRTAPLFETASPKYAWLNTILTVGVGRLTRTGVAYEIYRIL